MSLSIFSFCVYFIDIYPIVSAKVPVVPINKVALNNVLKIIFFIFISSFLRIDFKIFQLRQLSDLILFIIFFQHESHFFSDLFSSTFF